MVGWSRLEGIGAVRARLLYPDGRVQHAGVVHGLDEGLAGHAFRLLPRWERGTFNLASVSRNCAAVTAACMLTPRELFSRVGGFDEARFAVAYNDPDYCHRLVNASYRIVYCTEPEASLITRGYPAVSPATRTDSPLTARCTATASIATSARTSTSRSRRSSSSPRLSRSAPRRVRSRCSR